MSAAALVFVLAKLSLLAASIADGSSFALLVLMCAGVLALVASPLVLLPARGRVAIAVVLDFGVSAVVVADAMHQRVFGDSIALAEVAYAHQLLDVLPSVARLLRLSDGLYFADVIAGAIVVAFYGRLPHPATHLSGRLVVAAGLLTIGFAIILSIRAAVARDPRIYAGVRYRLSPDAAAVGAPQYQRVVQFLASREMAPKSELFGVAAGRNVILIQAESLSSYPLDLVIDGALVTPSLSAFARESLHFVDFYDQTWSGGTSDGEFTALQSLHPVRGAAVSYRYADRQYRALPAVLTERGYFTASACGAAGGFWNMKTIHARLGFQRSYFEDSYAVDERVNGWMADHLFFEQTVPRVVAQKRPFMAFLVSSSNHHPFDTPPQHRHLRLPRTLQRSELGDYLQSVRYFDEAFGQLVRLLRSSGLLDESIVVLYGDHKGYVGDIDAAATRVNAKQRSHEIWLLRRRVPLIVRLPHGSHAGVRHETGGHLDIAPTILALLGIDVRRSVMLGRDLSSGQPGLVVFRDGSFVTRSEVLIRDNATAVCFERPTGQRLSCASLEQARRRALDQLQTSDFIIQGDLIPSLRDIVSHSSFGGVPLKFPARPENRKRARIFEK